MLFQKNLSGFTILVLTPYTIDCSPHVITIYPVTLQAEDAYHVFSHAFLSPIIRSSVRQKHLLLGVHPLPLSALPCPVLPWPTWFVKRVIKLPLLHLYHINYPVRICLMCTDHYWCTFNFIPTSHLSTHQYSAMLLTKWLFPMSIPLLNIAPDITSPKS